MKSYTDILDDIRNLEFIAGDGSDERAVNINVERDSLHNFVQEVKEALEKQIPKKLVWMTEKEVYQHKTADKCSVCGEPIYWSPKAKYCPYCGQRWADYDD